MALTLFSLRRHVRLKADRIAHRIIENLPHAPDALEFAIIGHTQHFHFVRI